ncbi:MAG: hypothetical protein KDK07_24425 [Bauldia sp.]|nr:hypothetical protein [Bauldia sp.]
MTGAAGRGFGRRLARAGLALAVLAVSAVSAFADGAWKERSQLVWDASAGKLVRQMLRAWDVHPELGLDFVWEPDGGAVAAGPINGTGRLIWLARGAAAYDRTAIFSEYEGEVSNGRPHGMGNIKLKSGLTYDGTWRDGHMIGYGVLRFENGDRYAGAVDDGAPEGFGRYASVDGTIYEGRFVHGRRDGAGTLTTPDTRRFRSVWKDGVETDRAPLDDPSATVAQAGGVTVSTYIDTRLNNQFIDADVDMLSYAYTATPSAGQVDIRLDAPQILDVWKGDAVLRDDAVDQSAWLFEDPGQFAPVFLVVELGNEGNQTAQVTSAWFDLAESVTDYQPYVVIYGSGADFFDPGFALQNFGWGEATEATLTYAFGAADGPVTQDFVTRIGAIDSYQDVTTVDAMIALGVDVDRLSDWESLECPRFDANLRCGIEVGDYADLLGDLAPAAFVTDNYLKTRLTGQLEYQWVDAWGNANTRVSPVSIDIPLVYLGERAEGGAPGPIERGFPTIALPLDQQNVRIPIPFTADLAPGESRRFALNFVAEKSSHHVFQFVFELADGNVALSPTVDLLYFTPRLAPLN